jgi:N-acetylneuraminate synthase
MSADNELGRAVEILKSGANRKLTILQCTSEYPCPPEQVGLKYISELKEKYGVAVGFSDHTLSESIPAVAVYAGATVVEKHFTLSKSMYGSDAANSLEPESFARMVGFIKEAEILCNTSPPKDVDREYIRGMKQVFEKSLVYKASYPAGHKLSYDDVTAKKPGDGIPTRRVDNFVGKELKHSVVSDTLLLEGDFHY